MQPRDLSTHDTYQAGRGVEEVARRHDRDTAEFITLSSNENPLGPPQAAVDAVENAASSLHRYPKAVHVDLVEHLANKWDVADEQVWLAAGADGAIDYLSRAMLKPGDAVLVPDPGFAYYGMSARFHHGTVSTYELDKTDGFPLTPDTVLESYTDQRLVYLTTPHNPTGGTITPEGIATIAEKTNEETLVIVDEAYAEYTDNDSAISLIPNRSDVAVLRTFSKAYGLAGLRLGYALVPTEWSTAYTRVNTPFAASEVACRAGLAALTATDHLEATVELTAWARNHLESAITAPTFPSEANFVLIDVANAPSDNHQSPASAVTNALETAGVLVRDCTSFGLPDCIRVTCGTKPETKQAVQALNEVLTG